MQRVKQKMRIQLHLQGLELCLSQSSLQFRCVEFTLLVFPVVLKCLAHRENHPVNQKIKMPRFYQQWLECLFKTRAALPLPKQPTQQHVSQRKQNACWNMYQKTLCPASGLESEPARKCHDRDRQHCEYIPIP